MAEQKANHQVFVDFENTQNIDLNLTRNKNIKVILLMGEKQKNLSISFVKQLLCYSNKIQIIETQSSGKNALDFILAFYLGQSYTLNKQHYFYIISKDKGYDSLIKHLNFLNINIERYDDFAQLPIFHLQAKTKNIVQADNQERSQPLIQSDDIVARKLSLITDHLRKHDKARPKKQTSLVNFLKSHLRQENIQNFDQLILREMLKSQIIKINNNTVHYSL